MTPRREVLADGVEIPDASTELRVVRHVTSREFERDPDEFYTEPAWCSRRLFESETFIGEVWDPCSGLGTIIKSARDFGLTAHGSDIINRAQNGTCTADVGDFLGFDAREPINSIVTNPPFGIAHKIAAHALSLSTTVKIAMIFPTARLHAAHWLADLPLRRVWLMTPRPPMPPGRMIAAGGKAGGGKVDFCWIVIERGFDGRPELRWLRRDGEVW